MTIGTDSILSDDFTRADNSSTLGSNFTVQCADGTASTFGVVGNKAQYTSGGSGSNLVWAKISSALFGAAPQRVRVCINEQTVGAKMGAVLRLTTSGNTPTCYFLGKEGSGAFIRRYDAGVATDLVAFQYIGAWDGATGDFFLQFDADTDGSGNVVLTVSSASSEGGTYTQRATYTDNSASKITGAGTAGLAIATYYNSGNLKTWDYIRVIGTAASAAATLSSPTPSGTIGTATTATIGATTDQASGTAYTILSTVQTDVTTATDANVKAGQIVGGTSAQGSGNASVTSTTIAIPVTGLGAGVLYYYSEIQNSTGGDSNRIDGNFTTLAVTNYTENQPATATVSSATTGTITFANTPVSGELLVVTIAQNSGTATVTPPAGWTQKATINPTSRRLSVFYKVAGGSESGSYTFTFSVAVSAGMCGRRVSPQAGYGWSGTQNGVDISTSSDSAVSSVSTTGGSSNIGNLYVAVGYSANTNASNKQLLPAYGWNSSNLLYSSRSLHAIRPTSGVQQIFGFNLTDAATDTRNAVLVSEFLQVATSPAISSIDDSTPNYLGSLVITGNASALPFPTSQSGNAGITIDGVAQTVTWNTTTSCSIASIARGASKYGTSVNIILTDASGNASPGYATTLSPQTGWAYVDTSGTLATSGDRITAVSDIVSGDQIIYGNVQGGTIADVTVYEDGSFTWNAGVTAFDVSINDGTGFSSTVTQTIAAATTSVGGIARALSTSPTRAITSAPT